MISRCAEGPSNCKLSRPLHSRFHNKNGYSSRARVLKCRALETVTEDEIAALPWAKPGYRGAFVSSQTPQVQTIIVSGVTALGALLTYFSCTAWGPWICENVPSFDRYMALAPFIQGPLFALAGAAHFVVPRAFTNFYPAQGSWGFWYLPGTPSFHVYWTGVAEIMGGVGITLGASNLAFVPDWVLPASAFGLFLLTVVVSPSNMYMWTHNSPGPLSAEDFERIPIDVMLPLHLSRAALQVVLLSTFLGLAIQSYS